MGRISQADWHKRNAMAGQSKVSAPTDPSEHEGRICDCGNYAKTYYVVECAVWYLYLSAVDPVAYARPLKVEVRIEAVVLPLLYVRIVDYQYGAHIPEFLYMLANC